MIGLLTGRVWQLAAVLLLAALAGAGWQWNMAAHDCDQALADLATERKISADLQASIREQNRAVEALGAAKLAADERGRAAQKLAAANGKRFDGALARIATAKAATCDDAMPFVDQIIQGVR